MDFTSSYASIGDVMQMYGEVKDLMTNICKKFPEIVGPDTTITLTHAEASKVTHYLNDLLTFIRTTDSKMPFPL